MKKLLVLSLIMNLLMIMNCGKSDKPAGEMVKSDVKVQEKYVRAKGGLNMRDKPETSGAVIVNIPDGEGVQILEETGGDIIISGSTGKWTKAKWGEKTGWVFGGFLEGEKNAGLLDRIKNKTIVLGENVQDGPLFFMAINGDNTFAAVCQASHLGRGADKGTLKEKYSGKWIYEEKSARLFLKLTGNYKSAVFTKTTQKYEGVMKESILEAALDNGKLIFTMKNSQTHDSCFTVETNKNNYLWEIKNSDYFSKLMKDVYFP